MYSVETRIFLAILSGVFVLLVLMTFFIVTIIRYQRKKVAFHLGKIKTEFIFLDKERERIGFDLHDDLGASLSAIKLRLQCLKGMDAENTLLVDKSELLIDEAMQKLRRISFNMMPGVLQRRGLDEALKELIDLMTYSTSITVNYKCDFNSFDKEKAVHIYRIIQEIMNNIIKHSKATLVNLSISKIKNIIELHVNDNGVGFNKNTIIKNPQGLGLQNIVARVDILKAKIYLTTEQHKGVDYLIEIPSNER
jgi:signal transduction histidine kinase